MSTEKVSAAELRWKGRIRSERGAGRTEQEVERRTNEGNARVDFDRKRHHEQDLVSSELGWKTDFVRLHQRGPVECVEVERDAVN